MSEPQSPDLRIGDTEREQAIEALTTHSKEGRLSIDEYGDRIAGATDSRTRAELLRLFDDLPEPRPHLGELSVVEPAPTPAGGDAPRYDPAERDRPVPARKLWARAVVPLGAAAAVGLSFATGNWVFMFVVPPVTYAVEGMLRGRRHREGSEDREDREEGRRR